MRTVGLIELSSLIGAQRKSTLVKVHRCLVLGGGVEQVWILTSFRGTAARWDFSTWPAGSVASGLIISQLDRPFPQSVCTWTPRVGGHWFYAVVCPHLNLESSFKKQVP